MAKKCPSLPPRTVHLDGNAGEWLLKLETFDDPIVLSRVLQKLSVPSVDLLALHYVRTDAIGSVTLRLQGSEAWLSLLQKKLAKLVSVRSVQLQSPDPLSIAKNSS